MRLFLLKVVKIAVFLCEVESEIYMGADNILVI